MIYRVMVKKLLPYAAEWVHQVAYCGTDRTEARITYLRLSPHDSFGGNGATCQHTVLEEIPDDDSDDWQQSGIKLYGR